MWKCVDKMGLTSKRKKKFRLPAACDAINEHLVGIDNRPQLTDPRHTAWVAFDERLYFQHVTANEVTEAVQPIPAIVAPTSYL